MTQQSVVVDLGSSAVGACPGLEGPAARVERRFRGTGRDPVFEAVGWNGGFGPLGDEKEPGDSLVAKIGKTLRIAGPPDELDVHECNVSSQCFIGITAR